MGELVEFLTTKGPAQGYLALPPDQAGPGLIVVQEWWGLVPQIREVADGFAEEGFVTLVPDLYHGEATEKPDEASRMMQELSLADAATDLTAALDHLLSREEVTGERAGVVGFCMGGALALVAGNEAPHRIAAVVSFYGVFWYGDPDLSNVRCPVLMHIGTEDAVVPLSKVEELAERMRAAGTQVTVERYSGAGHAFFNHRLPDNYAPEAARQAGRSTIRFLQAHLM